MTGPLIYNIFYSIASQSFTIIKYSKTFSKYFRNMTGAATIVCVDSVNAAFVEG